MENNFIPDFYYTVNPTLQHWRTQDNYQQWVYHNTPVWDNHYLYFSGEGDSDAFRPAPGGGALPMVPLDAFATPAPQGRAAVGQGVNVPRKKKNSCLRNATPWGQRKRKRTKFLNWQLQSLEHIFFRIAYPNVELREEIGRTLLLAENKIQIWFQNRRARFNKSRKKEIPLCTQEYHLPYGNLNYLREPLASMQAVEITESPQLFYAGSPEFAEEQVDVYGTMRQAQDYSCSEAFYSNQMMENFEPSQMLHVCPEGNMDCNSQTTLSLTSSLIYNSSAILTNEF